MPIYEYACNACGETFSKLQKMGTGEGETACPKCGGSDVQRLISGCSIGGGSTGGATGGFSGG